MTLVFNPQLENSPLDTVRDALDSGGAPGHLQILDGSTVLATLGLSLPSFTDESGGLSVANPIFSAEATAAGTATGFAFRTALGDFVFGGDIPDDLNLGATAISAGVLVNVSSYLLTEGTAQAREYVSTVPYPYAELVPPAPTNWGPMTRDLNSGSTARAIFSFGGDGSGVWVAGFDSAWAARSTDSGVTWGPLTRGLNSGSTSAQINGVSTDRQGNWVAVQTTGYAARSTDNGATWSALPQGLNSGNTTASFFGLASDGAGTFVAVATSGWAARSTDGGATWTSLTKGLNSGSTSASFTKVTTDGQGTWVAVARSGWAARSIDNGATWSALPRGLNNAGAATEDGRAVCGNPDGVFVAAFGDGYAVASYDGGATWAPSLPQGLNSGTFDTVTDVACDEYGRFVAVMAGGFAALSQDSAATWSALPRFLNSGSGGATAAESATYSAGIWMVGFSQGHAARSPEIAP